MRIELVEMVDHRRRREAVDGRGAVAETHEDRRDEAALAVLRSMSLSPIIIDLDGSPPASAITPVRWPGCGFATGKVSRPASAVK